jgi:hypothetical protein
MKMVVEEGIRERAAKTKQNKMRKPNKSNNKNKTNINNQ